ncbi:MAG: SGNH/GDSL hydrolase family protein [Polyangiaceae bacterium]|nr:SGNH/GDSL hydrolase family protein [Polyangiaceae bacterium]
MATVVAADLGLRRVSAPRYVREVQDALAEYKHEDPTVLVLGSSHARTFTYMDAVARSRSNGSTRVMGVPLEWGKFTSYEWVLQERLRPFIEEVENGKRKRSSLKHAILLTAWWDACGKDGDPPVFNLPSRAWAFEHFARDVADRGVTAHNRNYVTARWLEHWHGSILVSARGHDHLVSAVRDLVRPMSAEGKQKQWETHLTNWQHLIEGGAPTMGYEPELAAADRILAYFQSIGVDVTLMLYPLMPVTLTDLAKETVLRPFSKLMRQVAEKRGVRFIDATFDHNVVDSDFQPDFDHLTPDGHNKLANWLLDTKLSFLLETQPAGGQP